MREVSTEKQHPNEMWGCRSSGDLSVDVIREVHLLVGSGRLLLLKSDRCIQKKWCDSEASMSSSFRVRQRCSAVVRLYLSVKGIFIPGKEGRWV